MVWVKSIVVCQWNSDVALPYKDYAAGDSGLLFKYTSSRQEIKFFEKLILISFLK
ncbi:hypothetical protein DPMN_014976, partial [Dreissena polymorpha]